MPHQQKLRHHSFSVERATLTDDSAKSLWSLAHTDKDWPIAYRSLTNWLHQVKSFAMAVTLNSGDIQVLRANGQIAGFVTCSTVDPRFLPPSVCAVECGTYLLPEFRGTGLNALIKRPWMERAFALLDDAEDSLLHHPRAEDSHPCSSPHPPQNYCIYAVAAQNTRALRGLMKLGLPFEVWPNLAEKWHEIGPMAARSGSQVETSPRFSTLARRKTWETGEPVVICSVSQSDFMAERPPLLT